jgi:hypothetical protein
MELEAFVCELLESGRVRVSEPTLISAADESAADAALLAFERSYRRELPGGAPRFSLPVARWSAVVMLRICQFLVYRDVDEAAVSQALATPAPEPASPASHYSADLLLRFLPDVARLANGINPDDPLVEQLQKLAAAWPLSSVGMPSDGNVSLQGIVDDRCLLALYVDRVIAAQDTGRLQDERVRQAVRAALGIHDQLAPQIAAALATWETDGAQL